MSKILKFEGHNYFRQRLVLATLSGKILKIEKIRSNDANPGLRGKFPLFSSLFVVANLTIESCYQGNNTKKKNQ